MRTRPPAFALLLLAAGAAVAQRAKEPPVPQFGERVEVRLVQVDVWAVESGRPVLDLMQSELKLTEDGKPVEILYFSAPIVVPAAPAADVAPDAVAEEASGTAAATFEMPATVAILLDEAHLTLGGRGRTIAALREWVAGGGLPAHADAMLFTHERELKLTLGRTRDRARLLDAIDRLGKPPMLATEMQMAERWAIDQIHEEQRSAIEQERGLDAAAEVTAAQEADPNARNLRPFDPPCSSKLLRFADELADRVTIESTAALDSLSSLAESLAALNGRRLLLVVSEGVPARPGGAAYDYVRTLCDGSGAREGVEYATDVTGLGGEAAARGQLSAPALAMAGENRMLNREVEQVVARANSSGVTIWTLGARGLTESGTDAGQSGRTQTSATQSRQWAEANDVLNSLAVDTGGRAILDTNDFAAALGQFADDLFQAYSIAYESPRAGDGKLHKIRLETTRPGVQLRYRRSWRDGSAEEELARLVGGALAFGIDRPALGASAMIGRQSGEGGEKRLILRLTLPRGSMMLQPGEKGSQHGFLRLGIALQPVGGEATTIRARTITIDSPAGEGSDAAPMVYDVALPEIGAGSLVVVGLRDELSGEIGVLRVLVGGS